MRRFPCHCGLPVYFDNHSCSNCGRELAFDPDSTQMWAEIQPGDGLSYCSNRSGAISCNWLSPTGGPCLSCRTSKIIPTLTKPKNRERWRKLELAKRRLLYNVLRVGLPVDETQLSFVFKEDRRTNHIVSDEHVAIGHSRGVITINAAEADEIYREEMRQAMNEPLRTLLGHLRHESGHFYYDIVVNENNQARAIELFGDPADDYEAALRNHYSQGPRLGWEASFISAYATSHPAEDWAETWAHYLHIRSVLETAEDSGLMNAVKLANWREDFVELIIRVNEVLRSLGLPDAYPFVITDPVAEKIEFINRAVADYSQNA